MLLGVAEGNERQWSGADSVRRIRIRRAGWGIEAGTTGKQRGNHQSGEGRIQAGRIMAQEFDQ